MREILEIIRQGGGWRAFAMDVVTLIATFVVGMGGIILLMMIGAW